MARRYVVSSKPTPRPSRIQGYRTAIDFRNRLAHRYDDIDNAQVWEVIHNTLPVLLADAEQLLLEAERGVIDES